MTNNAATITTSVGTQNHVGSQIGQDDNNSQTQRGASEELSKSEGTQAGGPLQQTNTPSIKTTSTGTTTRCKDYNDEMVKSLKNLNFCLYSNFVYFSFH